MQESLKGEGEPVANAKENHFGVKRGSDSPPTLQDGGGRGRPPTHYPNGFGDSCTTLEFDSIEESECVLPITSLFSNKWEQGIV